MNERVDAPINEIAVFVAVAQSGSFTRAAEELGSSKSNVGKAVQRLEARLGTRLFQRTTRAVRLTEDGETYLGAAQDALDTLRDAEQQLASRRSEPAGRVKIDLPAGFGRLLLPSFIELRDRHPKITLEIALTDRMSDPIGEGWDVVVRIGALPEDSELTVRKLCDLRLGLYASPEYLARRGAVNGVDDLGGHDAVVFRGPTGRLRPWTLRDGASVREYAPHPVLVLADGQALIESAVAGFGIAQILDRVAQPYVSAGRLVHLLPDSDVDGPPVHAIISLGQKMAAKTRAVVNHLADTLQKTNG
ncbi:LysR family transcriptional regulator [Paraburkholderia caballeronis]|uniref:DNA-binding transcriptional regulator, LysR family n=1 Tax=Paraburkholderia caballeronis TaxID=416943 RepID=A0A1H7FXJ4_9BURK|nr:LysR family transcriptional regulator [Paraburkholderia caballeronis]PXW24794.1 LysR family transcriptional regulator [Paraburkholderia caballeronis]PXX00524.1 LysR family transcriptional regulator [Paraburkholderia caballeronis]RAJ98587.1 LysR family transcriptional regulator [Paraburkholderia caballeronis]TDV16591.1 LysR family transcriptional regulator [Paraburkholderia caballeronis]TDV18987.1 LysR family transcriptional regulator [Paraburkholderia caballeronis]